MRISDTKRNRKGDKLLIVCECGHEFWHSEKKWLVKCEACQQAVKLAILQIQAEHQDRRSNRE